MVKKKDVKNYLGTFYTYPGVTDHSSFGIKKIEMDIFFSILGIKFNIKPIYRIVPREQKSLYQISGDKRSILFMIATTTEKQIPNLKIPIANVLLEDTFTKEKYLSSLEKFEKECETYLLDLFKKLNLSTTVKRDRYSLPFQKELIVTLEGSAYLNSAFHFPAVAKEFTKHVLNLSIDHIRFYLFINLKENSDLGLVEYSLRYSVKNLSKSYKF